MGATAARAALRPVRRAEKLISTPQMEREVRSTYRQLMSLRPAIVVGVLSAGALLAAHEGHDAPQRPVYRQVQIGDAAYRVGFAVIPQDPLVGEDIRLEFRILQSSTQ